MKTIASFEGDTHFLSNFETCLVPYRGLVFTSAEAAYQSAKAAYPKQQAEFVEMSASASKKAGKNVSPLRENWNQVRIPVMAEVLWSKFTYNPFLIQKLLDTGDALLVEGNTWKDQFWGVDKTGMNWLGLLLMETRNYLRESLKLEKELEAFYPIERRETVEALSFASGWRLAVSGCYTARLMANPWTQEKKTFDNWSAYDQGFSRGVTRIEGRSDFREQLDL